MHLKPIALCFFITYTLLATAEVQTAANTRNGEQTVFGAEDKTVDRPVEVPEEALEILRKDETVLQYLGAEKKSPNELTTEPFLASEIHLDGPKETDLIVIGVGWLRGKAATFWVFRELSPGYPLVLKTTASGLVVRPARWKGFRIISAGTPIAGSAVEALYRFDGKRYRRFRETSQPIR